MIRRRKREVLAQLPARTDQNVFVPMTPEQARYHEENAEIVARIAAKWRRQCWLSEADQRRLAARGWDYAMFHGSVPSHKRGALVERFREDPSCRVFLSLAR